MRLFCVHACDVLTDDRKGYHENVFGSYDQPLWENCAELGQTCSYNLAGGAQPFTQPGAVCYQGSVPSYYVSRFDIKFEILQLNCPL